GTFSDGTTRDLTGQVDWTSSQPGVATIDPTTGVATGVTAGATQVTAALNGMSGSTALDVVPGAVIPDPPADDPTYFQVMIDDRTDQSGGDKRVVHLTYTASVLKLTSPAILNIAWLTGGGPNQDDWTRPVMNVVNSTSGATGVDFARTYDFTLSQLPMDASGRYRVLRIPFLDPTDPTRSRAGSGHLTITLDAPAPIKINTGGPGGFSFQLPSPDPKGVGGQLLWDFLEINCATPASNGKNVAFVDTTNVDFFALGLNIRGRSSDGSLTTFGLDVAGSRPVASLYSKLEALPAEYAAGRVPSTGAVIRFLAPDLAFTAQATSLATAIQEGYNFYTATPLVFSVSGVNYRATNVGGALQFTQPKNFSIAMPTTLDAIAATGPLNTGSTADADIQNAMKFIAAALNRGIFTNTAIWFGPVTSWYPPGVQHNQYSSLLHQNFVNGAVYAFSFDDVPSGGVLTAPAIGTCTSMTLVIDSE
ncbi:MAG: beta-1,3-glucanase family protein, partial [Candidatus Eremiobacterota bacterium]